MKLTTESEQSPAANELGDPNTFEARWEQYAEYLKALNNRELSNVEAHDRGIFAISSAMLALIGGVIYKGNADISGGLILGAAFSSFCISLALITISFRTGNSAISYAKERSYSFYIEEQATALKGNSKHRLTEIINSASTYFFVGGIFFVLIFGLINLITSNAETKEMAMSDKKTVAMLEGVGPAIEQPPRPLNPPLAKGATVETAAKPKPQPPKQDNNEK